VEDKGMQFEVTILLDVDEDTNFLGSDSTFYPEDLEDLIRSLFFDVDDVEIDEITVQEM